MTADTSTNQRLIVAGDPVMLNAVLLSHIPAIRAAFPGHAICFHRQTPKDHIRDADILLTAGKPDQPDLDIVDIGGITFSPYGPDLIRRPDDWAALGLETNSGLPTRLGYALFEKEPALRLCTIEAKISTMRHMQLAGILPDLVARKASGLRQMTELSYGVRIPMYLSHMPDRKNDSRITKIRALIKHVMQGSQHLNSRHALDTLPDFLR